MYLLYRHIQKKRKAKKAAAAEAEHAHDGTSPTDGNAPSKHAATTVGSSGSPSTEKPDPAAAAEVKAAAKRRRQYRLKLILGLLLPYFIASTDVTIIATALPFIASHFDQLGQLNWIVTAFTITSTAFIPFWGQVSDIFGRHAVLQTVMAIMMVGAALAAGAQAWTMLLFGRAIMGVAAAGILNIIKIVLADGVTLEENAKNTTVFALVGGLSFGVGPVIGGYLTNVTWRWCFILNIPIAAAAMVGIWVLLRNELQGPKPRERDVELGRSGRLWSRLSEVDYGGLVLFVGGVALIILGTTWGGATYPWKSVHVIVPIALGGCLFIIFFLYEYLLEPGNLLARILPTQQPMIPLHLFRKKDLPLLAWISFSTGSAMYSIFYFVGIYFTIVKKYSSDDAGVSLLYYLPGIGVGSYMAMFLANFWPKQTWYPLMIGSILETVGFGVLIEALNSERTAVIGGMMGLTGAGTGLRLMPETLHVAGIWPDHLARAISVIDFSVPFGGTIALAMMGAVFNNKLIGKLPSGAQGGSLNPHNQGSLDSINALPPDQQTAFRDAAKHAVVFSFVAVLPIIGLAIVAALLMGNVNLAARQEKTDEGTYDTSENVESRPFLWAAIKGPRRRNVSAEYGEAK